MNTTGLYDALLRSTRDTYAAHAGLSDFAPFPTDLTRQSITPRHRASCDALRGDGALVSQNYRPLQQAIVAAGPAMFWRETYKAGPRDTRFMERLGCYSIIGEGGPFDSAQSRLFIVYMPAGLYYPWHTHPAEEAYMIVSGTAVFRREACRDEILSEGQMMVHDSNLPHAIETGDSPMLALVVWRSHLHTPPVLVDVDPSNPP